MRVSVGIRRFFPGTTPMNEIPARLVVENDCEFEGFSFGYPKAVSNEVVFNLFWGDF